jgi:hypothetical protein
MAGNFERISRLAAGNFRAVLLEQAVRRLPRGGARQDALNGARAAWLGDG